MQQCTQSGKRLDTYQGSVDNWGLLPRGASQWNRLASPCIAWGASLGHAVPPAHPEAKAEEDEEMYGTYVLLTNRCWAKLIRLNKRLAKHTLVNL